MKTFLVTIKTETSTSIYTYIGNSSSEADADARDKVDGVCGVTTLPCQ